MAQTIELAQVCARSTHSPQLLIYVFLDSEERLLEGLGKKVTSALAV